MDLPGRPLSSTGQANLTFIRKAVAAVYFRNDDGDFEQSGNAVRVKGSTGDPFWLTAYHVICDDEGEILEQVFIGNNINDLEAAGHEVLEVWPGRHLDFAVLECPYHVDNAFLETELEASVGDVITCAVINDAFRWGLGQAGGEQFNMGFPASSEPLTTTSFADKGFSGGPVVQYLQSYKVIGIMVGLKGEINFLTTYVSIGEISQELHAVTFGKYNVDSLNDVEMTAAPHGTIEIINQQATQTIPSSLACLGTAISDWETESQVVIDAVITVPMYLNHCQRQTTYDAAGNNLDMISEPTAGALVFGLDREMTGKQNLPVFDLHGGTFDVSVVTATRGTTSEAFAVTGGTHVGDEDFNSRSVCPFIDEFNCKFNKELRNNAKAVRGLGTACERAKRMLSISNDTGLDLDSLHKGIDLQSKIAQSKFEDLCVDFFR